LHLGVVEPPNASEDIRQRLDVERIATPPEFPPVEYLEGATMIGPNQQKPSRRRFHEDHAERLVERQQCKHIAQLVNRPQIF
jgi:hypothetical protein